MYEIQMGGSALGKVGFGSLATLVMASAALALPQEAWTQEGDAPGMGNRYLSSIVYDSDRHEVLTILGGHASGHYSEIWSWAAATWSWSKVWDGSSDGPDDRGQAAADDDGQGNTWLFGGYQGGEQIYFDDTWRWDGTSWTEEEFDGGPTPGFRSAAVMVYDSDRDVFVLFGGWVDGVGYVDDTWELDPEEGWSQVHPGGGGCPTQRGAHGMTYDTRTKRALLYGGTDDPYNEVALDDMWAWDGSEWELLAPAEPGGPGPRTGHGMAQDPETGLIYLYGGMTHVGMNPRYADLWTWDGTMWDLVHDGITPPAPVGRSHTDIAFVEDHDEVLLYGGESHQGTVLGDTWTFDPDPEDDVTYYCIGAPNSVGSGARIGYVGSTSIAANDFHLTVAHAPPHQFGLFYFGPSQTEVPFGNGYRCVAPLPTGIFRLGPASPTNADGTLIRHVDFTVLSGSDGQILSESTWNFQLWYRDPAHGGEQFNLSDALSATFRP